ncbi:MAG TPA: caspase family protein [Rhodocyclaceae bacterium]|nr:caspase family protein [Rhodocyclaceae bacterium]
MSRPRLSFRTPPIAARLICASLFVAALWPAAATAQITRPTPEQLALAQHQVDQLLVVDCMLPGQVRRLGTKMTYLTARRPAKLNAEECGLRGGEYVMYDRADLATALSVWLPLANSGDREAQTYVGEIYERGIGGEPPRHAEAAAWYRKAAEQGHPRAMINLGFLYEKGLGVPRDSAAALSLYRKAAGLGEAIALEGVDVAARDAEIRTLRRELEETRRQLDDARRELERQRGATQGELRRLEEQIRKAEGAGDDATVARLTAQLHGREADLSARDRQVSQLSATVEQYRRQLAALESETVSLRDQLAQARSQLADSEAELAAREARVREDQARLQALRQELEQQRTAAGRADSEATRRLEAQLKLSEQELARQRDEIVRVQREAREYKERLTALETRDTQTASAATPGTPDAVAIAPPSIQLIDPPVVLTRSPAVVKVRGRTATRELVGKVTAPAGLLSFTVNDVAQKTNDLGMFKTAVPLMGEQTPVNLVAVDRRGRRAELEFLLVPDAVDVGPSPTQPRYITGINFGRYHALVIGNQDYPLLPRLDTAVADAKAIADVLASKYGFKVTLLTNATRYELLSALNKLRSELTDQDNLLIYYAGHGEIDRANLRGHWLPVDAEPNSDANWISNVSITDLLNAMSVKHALVIADSCYAGTLTRSSIGQLESGVSDDARVKWLKAIVQARVRTVLTSGGVQPVMDGGGGDHSVFAKSLLEVLRNNEDALEAQRVYREVAARVLDRASRFQIDQRPEYAPLRFAGHESGDFLFVPVQLVAGR